MEKIQLPEELVEKLSSLPEQGMGYQIVNVTLKSGETLRDRRVLNSEWLVVAPSEKIETKEIENVELS